MLETRNNNTVNNGSGTTGPRRSLSSPPAFEPPLEGAGGAPVRSRGPVSRAALPCHHRMPSRGVGAPIAGDPGEASDSQARRHATRRTPHDGRSAAHVPADESSSAAKRFAELSLRVVLEVLDGRRGAAQLRPLADPAVLAAVQTLARTGADERRLGTAVLVSVNIVSAGPAAAEVFGGYERGGRRFAVAARITARRGEWRLAALRLR